MVSEHLNPHKYRQTPNLQDVSTRGIKIISNQTLIKATFELPCHFIKISVDWVYYIKGEEFIPGEDLTRQYQALFHYVFNYKFSWCCFPFSPKNKKWKMRNVNFSEDPVTLKPHIWVNDLLLLHLEALGSNIIRLIMNAYIFTRICNLSQLSTGHWSD